MAVFTAFVYEDNFRGVEGCDSRAAVAAIMAAITERAESLDDHAITVKTRRGQGHPTIQVQAEDSDDAGLEEGIADTLTAAADGAISDGDWEDEA